MLAAAAVASPPDGKPAITGTNIGGWLVLEPWITPSLFYRFLGKSKGEVGMDSWTFCEALGPEEGNRIMRSHYENWVTEKDIKDLADREVKIIRVPVGDWTFNPYGPYVGCMDGAEDKISWLLDTAEAHGIMVWLDVHAMKGSQNGFDNSGVANKTIWSDENNFTHWPNQAGEWVGPWNADKKEYDYIDWYQIKWAEDMTTDLVNKWGKHKAVYGIEPINEPWEFTPLDVLKDFYRKTRRIIKDVNPDLKFIFHESFRF